MPRIRRKFTTSSRPQLQRLRRLRLLLLLSSPRLRLPLGQSPQSPTSPFELSIRSEIVIAQKLKKQVSESPFSKATKDLVGGKFTLQSEILGNLNLEFTPATKKGEELSVDELGASLGYSGTPGKHTSGLISRLVGGKMPGGFNLTSIKAHLRKTCRLGPLRSDGVPLLGLMMEPPKRLGSEAEANTWLDSVVAAYAQSAGISLASGVGGGEGGGGGGRPVANSKEFIKFQAA